MICKWLDYIVWLNLKISKVAIFRPVRLIALAPLSNKLCVSDHGVTRLIIAIDYFNFRYNICASFSDNVLLFISYPRLR